MGSWIDTDSLFNSINICVRSAMERACNVDSLFESQSASMTEDNATRLIKLHGDNCYVAMMLSTGKGMLETAFQKERFDILDIIQATDNVEACTVLQETAANPQNGIFYYIDKEPSIRPSITSAFTHNNYIIASAVGLPSYELERQKWDTIVTDTAVALNLLNRGYDFGIFHQNSEMISLFNSSKVIRDRAQELAGDNLNDPSYLVHLKMLQPAQDYFSTHKLANNPEIILSEKISTFQHADWQAHIFSSEMGHF